MKGGFIVRIPWSSGPLRYHSLQAPGKDHHHCHHHQDLLINALDAITTRRGWVLSLLSSIFLMQSASGRSTGVHIYLTHI